MCRIVGIASIKDRVDESILVTMRDTLTYGGPDSANIYINTKGNVGLGHRRLSIIDLSAAGDQPMRYKHWVLVFNGELYNYKEIRDELTKLGHSFITDSDTEVLLHAFEEWSYNCVEKFRGMFAFCIYDENDDSLILVRDRIGVKPLYYYSNEGLFMFASELKAFHEHPEFDKSVDLDSVRLFLRQGFIQSPHSIFNNVKKVPPGSILKIDRTHNFEQQEYWNIDKKFDESKQLTGSEEEIVEELEPILLESFKYRMVADVPVGLFLSGGIDSSIVTAMLQKETNQQLKTFTIGFEDGKYNEAEHAKHISKHIGTDHMEWYCSKSEFESIIPEFPEFFDEPLGAGSAIPTYFLSKMAKEKVKVCLSADGGDEIFGGYVKYQLSKNFSEKFENIPHSLRSVFAKSLKPISPKFIEKRMSNWPFFKNYTNVGTKFSKFKNSISSANMHEFFLNASRIISEHQLDQLFPKGKKPYTKLDCPHPDRKISFLGNIDFKNFMEGEVMVKVDRSTMRVALEGREPFLDQNIIEFGQRIPDHLKIQGNNTKYLLRKILYKYVPKELIERPKQGFDIPMRSWTKGFLKKDILEMASSLEFVSCFQMNGTYLKSLINDYMEGHSQIDPHFIWYLYVLYKWYKRWLS